MAEHPRNSTPEPRNATDVGFLTQLDERLMRIAVRQTLASLLLLLWLFNRRGWPLVRGLSLGCLYLSLNLYQGYHEKLEASGWILPIYLASLDFVNRTFIVLTAAGGIAGMACSAIFLHPMFRPYALVIVCTDAAIMAFCLLIMWQCILMSMKGPSRETLRTLLISLTIFSAGIIVMKILETALGLSNINIL